MLTNTLTWRSVNHPAPEWRDVLRAENSTGKMYVRGFDRHGHALVYMTPRNENTNDHEGNLKHLIYTMDRAVECEYGLND